MEMVQEGKIVDKKRGRPSAQINPMEQDSADNSKWFTHEAEEERIMDSLRQKTAEDLRALGWEDTEENRNRLFHRQKAEIIENAKKGDPKAQCLLAGLYICGIDEKEDVVQGHAWFRIAQMNGLNYQSDYYGIPSPEQSEAAELLARQMIEANPDYLR